MEMMVSFFVVQIGLYVLYRWDLSVSRSKHRESMAKMLMNNKRILVEAQQEKNKTLILLKRIEEHGQQRKE